MQRLTRFKHILPNEQFYALSRCEIINSLSLMR